MLNIDCLCKEEALFFFKERNEEKKILQTLSSDAISSGSFLGPLALTRLGLVLSLMA